MSLRRKAVCPLADVDNVHVKTCDLLTTKAGLLCDEALLNSELTEPAATPRLW